MLPAFNQSLLLFFLVPTPDAVRSGRVADGSPTVPHIRILTRTRTSEPTAATARRVLLLLMSLPWVKCLIDGASTCLACARDGLQR